LALALLWSGVGYAQRARREEEPWVPYEVDRRTFVDDHGHLQDKLAPVILSSARSPLPRLGAKHKIGRLGISPDVVVTATYSDNVFSEHRDTTSALVCTVSPAVSLSLPLGRRSRVAATYGVEMTRADHLHDELESDVHFFTFDVDLGLGITPAALRTVRMKLAHDVQRHEVRSYGKGFKPRPYWSNTTTLNVGRQAGRLDAAFTYRHEAVDFVDEGKEDDVDSDRFRLRLTREVTKTTGAYVSYTYEMVDNRGKDADHYRSEVRVGLAMKPKRRSKLKITGDLGVGFEQRKFARTQAGHDIEGVTASADVGYIITKKLQFRGRAYRKTIETTMAQSREPEPPDPGEDPEGSLSEGRAYWSTGFAARLFFLPTPELTTYVGALYIMDDYDTRIVGRDPPVVRDDTLTGTEAGVTWHPKRLRGLAMGLSYEHTDNKSNIWKYNRSENRAMASASFAF